MAISYISTNTLAQLSVLTNIGTQADNKRTTHCSAKLITNNSANCGTNNSSNCTANHSSQYGTVNGTKVTYANRCTGHCHSNS